MCRALFLILLGLLAVKTKASSLRTLYESSAGLFRNPERELTYGKLAANLTVGPKTIKGIVGRWNSACEDANDSMPTAPDVQNHTPRDDGKMSEPEESCNDEDCEDYEEDGALQTCTEVVAQELYETIGRGELKNNRVTDPENSAENSTDYFVYRTRCISEYSFPVHLYTDGDAVEARIEYFNGTFIPVDLTRKCSITPLNNSTVLGAYPEAELKSYEVEVYCFGTNGESPLCQLPDHPDLLHLSKTILQLDEHFVGARKNVHLKVHQNILEVDPKSNKHIEILTTPDSESTPAKEFASTINGSFHQDVLRVDL